MKHLLENYKLQKFISHAIVYDYCICYFPMIITNLNKSFELQKIDLFMTIPVLKMDIYNLKKMKESELHIII